MQFRNEHEFRVFSLSRTGSHAIINWIASMCDEPIYFFNLGGDWAKRWSWARFKPIIQPVVNYVRDDPFRTRTPRGDTPEMLLKNFVQLPKMNRWSEERILPVRLQKKRWLMCRYENFPLSKLKGRDKDYPISNRAETLGYSKKVYDILILRDVFNFIASLFSWRTAKNEFRLADFVHKIKPSNEKQWLKDAKNICKRTYKEIYLSRWIIYAHEFLGYTNYLQNTKICISYNQWFNDHAYRVMTAKQLGLENSDVSLQHVVGWPSGFDVKKDFDGRAHEMKVLERWKKFKDNRIYWKFLHRKPEAIELSRKIFGDILTK